MTSTPTMRRPVPVDSARMATPSGTHRAAALTGERVLRLDDMTVHGEDAEAHRCSAPGPRWGVLTDRRNGVVLIDVASPPSTCLPASFQTEAVA
jgi:hypothetical protein